MSRQKQVFADAAEVAHVWAQQTQSHGRNPHGNCYFYGATLFSYGNHYRAAAIVATRSGRVALINSTTYSVTTTTHTTVACDATRHITRFHVPNVAEAPTRVDHVANLRAWFAEVAPLVAKQRKARTNDYRPAALRAIREAARYAGVFRCRALLTKRQRTLCDIVARLDAGALDLAAAFAEVANWSADDVKREALREAAHAREVAKRRAEAEAAEKRRQTVLAELRPRAIDAWRQGASLRDRVQTLNQFASIGDCLPRHALLRLSRDGAEVETSLGARVPVDDAKRAWPALKARQLPEGMIGHYRPDSVNGNFRIGCHVIPMAEVDAIAAQLGLE